MTNIAENLARLTTLMRSYEKKYERPVGAVSLLAASKQQSIEKMMTAFQAGQRAFGENYAQEAIAKQAALLSLDKSTAAIEWHFIGNIQQNKTRQIAEHFAWVHSVTDLKTLVRLDAQRPASLPPLNICIQIKFDRQSQGCDKTIDALSALTQACQSLTRLRLRGLMMMPPPSDDFETQRRIFHQLSLLWQSLKEAYATLDTLSAGMSSDFEAAIAEGSTIIRIGTALFGKRL
ncbi:MAG TPA: YggS family pyridoxal phosphate-dependent enzyme [Gammaproteobacteria bacterium]|jgi:pyridoxal phosphate enzyme (YggS family)|nr:YggS family pyridoxal phosphate-dependent enzyme [Gammaproteobacteria bacterium]